MSGVAPCIPEKCMRKKGYRNLEWGAATWTAPLARPKALPDGRANLNLVRVGRGPEWALTRLFLFLENAYPIQQTPVYRVWRVVSRLPGFFD